MTILITGGTGFVGKSLIERLQHVSVTSRNALKARQQLGDTVDQVIEWDPANEPLNLAGAPPFDSVVNLMGESIAEGRWSSEKKKRIRNSRVDGTRKLVDGLIDSGVFPGLSFLRRPLESMVTVAR